METRFPFSGFTTYGGVVAVSALNQNALAYVVRNDIDQISVLDNQTQSPVDFAIYHCHPFTGNDQHRDLRKKIARVLVFGEGQISGDIGSAMMTVVGDSDRSDVYVYSEQSAVPSQQILWYQQTLNLQARVFDICLFLTGTGLVIREVQVEYTPVG